jgi:hypothetical protein
VRVDLQLTAPLLIIISALSAQDTTASVMSRVTQA